MVVAWFIVYSIAVFYLFRCRCGNIGIYPDPPCSPVRITDATEGLFHWIEGVRFFFLRRDLLFECCE